VIRKNIENSDMPVRIPTTLAPRRVRMRKIENGTSGLRVRSSITTKATIRARPTPPRTRVSVEVQPAFAASTRA